MCFSTGDNNFAAEHDIVYSSRPRVQLCSRCNCICCTQWSKGDDNNQAEMLQWRKQVGQQWYHLAAGGLNQDVAVCVMTSVSRQIMFLGYQLDRLLDM